jgi:hypothetical protein
LLSIRVLLEEFERAAALGTTSKCIRHATPQTQTGEILARS